MESTDDRKYSVRIGPEFFAKIANDYRDYRWAWPREIMQNSIDCGSDYIKVLVETIDGYTVATVANNGVAMTREILTEKLLTLGGSGKNCDGTVGGFGVAKSLLYYMNRSYKITTGAFLVKGCGADYTITELAESFPGTESVVVFNKDITASLLANFRLFATLSQWRGTFELNGKIVEARLKKGQGRRNLGATEADEEGWGRVYTNKEDLPDGALGTVVVRIAGTPMFTRRTSFEGAVILELNGKSLDCLQSSRDALKWDFAAQLDQFCEDLVMNKRKALVDKRPTTEHTRFSGYKLKGGRKTTPYLDVVKRAQEEAGVSSAETGVIAIGGTTYDPTSPQGHVAAALINLVKATADPTSATYAQLNGGAARLNRLIEIPLRPEFVLKNETGLKIPDYYTPDNFSAYSKGLIWRWMGVLVTLADLYNAINPFAVGFIFTEEDTLAQYEESGGQRTIYIRPADVIRHEGKSPVLKASWSLTGGVIWDLVSYAAHEFTHYLGYDTHNEEFAAKLTEVMGVCLKERSRLAKVFQQRVEWPDTEKE